MKLIPHFLQSSFLMTEVHTPASASSNGAAARAPHPSAQQSNGVGTSTSQGSASGNSASSLGTLGAEPSGSQSPTTSTPGQTSMGRSPKKRRKVNHGKALGVHPTLYNLLATASRTYRLTQGRVIACVYCRRSHMTCDDGTLGGKISVWLSYSLLSATPNRLVERSL